MQLLEKHSKAFAYIAAFVCVAAARAAAIVSVVVASHLAVAIHAAHVVAVHVAYAVNINNVHLDYLQCPARHILQ